MKKTSRRGEEEEVYNPVSQGPTAGGWRVFERPSKLSSAWFASRIPFLAVPLPVIEGRVSIEGGP